MNISLEQKLEEMLEVMKNCGYTEHSIKIMRCNTYSLIEFLKELDLELNEVTVSQYEFWLSNVKNKNEEYNNYVTTHIRSARKFLLFVEKGDILARPPVITPKIIGPFSDTMNRFLEYLYQRNYCQVTISDYRRILRRFNSFLIDNRYEKINSISITEYFQSLTSSLVSPNRFYQTKTVIKHLLNYAAENRLLEDNLSDFLPHSKYMRTQLLPSTYTDDEIKRILSAINRSSASGKRDYAMILMLVCLGMRAGDVVSLQFSEINWEESIINITAKKNGKDLQFPLFNDIGNAIIDWLRNGRRKSDLPYIFIPIKGHIHPITSGCLNNALNKYMTKAGINIAGRRHGTHSMRHSLATRMITNGEELPVISEVLGHGDTQVTTVYTSIDTEALRKCCLEIPVLHSNCYEDL